MKRWSETTIQKEAMLRKEKTKKEQTEEKEVIEMQVEKLPVAKRPSNLTVRLPCSALHPPRRSRWSDLNRQTNTGVAMRERFGFVSALMQRVRLFHMFLFDIVQSPVPEQSGPTAPSTRLFFFNFSVVNPHIRPETFFVRDLIKRHPSDCSLSHWD